MGSSSKPAFKKGSADGASGESRGPNKFSDNRPQAPRDRPSKSFKPARPDTDPREDRSATAPKADRGTSKPFDFLGQSKPSGKPDDRKGPRRPANARPGDRPSNRTDDGRNAPERFEGSRASQKFDKSAESKNRTGASRPEKKSFGQRSSDRPERGGDSRPEQKSYGPRNSDRPERGGDSRPEKKSFGPRNPDRPERGGDSRPERKSYGSNAPDRRERTGEGRSENKAYGSKYPSSRQGSGSRRPGAPGQRSRVRSADGEARIKTGTGIRLNRYIAQAGISSRREADELIKAGLVSVNGEVMVEMGYQVKPTDEVRFNGSLIKSEKLVYVLLNKPKGFITTVDDPKARKTVMELVAGACRERIYPVGRLDRATTGVLLFTNDGDLADKLTHPGKGARKVYEAVLDKPLTKGDLSKMVEGVALEDGLAQADAASFIEGKDRRHVGIELHIGRNRVVRRMFEALGYEVTKLDRSSFAGLTKKKLNRGQWRHLEPQEVKFLKTR